jgi:hypothetical protein
MYTAHQENSTHKMAKGLPIASPIAIVVPHFSD